MRRDRAAGRAASKKNKRGANRGPMESDGAKSRRKNAAALETPPSTPIAEDIEQSLEEAKEEELPNRQEPVAEELPRKRGPHTPEGKARSSMNALKHGLRARTVLLPEEDPEEFRALRESLHEEWRPRSTTERILVNQMAESTWRMLRFAPVEAELLESLRDDEVPGGGLSAAFAGAMREGNQAMARLSRYETAIQRSFQRAMRMLTDLQKARSAPVPDESWLEDGGVGAEAREPLNGLWHRDPAPAAAVPGLGQEHNEWDNGPVTMERVILDVPEQPGSGHQGDPQAIDRSAHARGEAAPENREATPQTRPGQPQNGKFPNDLLALIWGEDDWDELPDEPNPRNWTGGGRKRAG